MYYKSKAFCVNGKLWVDKFNFIESLPLSVKKMQAFLYFRSLRFGISFALHYFCKHKYK